MGERKVVSVHERIPALKEQRKKRANRRLIISLTIIFLLIGIVVYLQSSLSHVQSIDVDGVVTGEEDEVVNSSTLETGENIWSADLRAAEASIEDNLPYVLDASVSRSLPTTLHIEIAEHNRMAYMEDDEAYVPVFANGETDPEQRLEQLPGDAPVLYGWNDESQLESFLSELELLTDGIVNRISEVHPQDEDHEQLRLYMNDGIEVETNVNQFAEYMSTYPVVSEELDPDEPGVLHMKMRPYFENENADGENDA